MIPAISSVLNSIVANTTVLKNAGGAGRIYELYLMTAIADSLKAGGASVWVQRSDGTRIHPGDSDRKFVQRGGAPSGLPGSAQGSSGMSTIAFQLNNSTQVWEIWNGVQFSGRSGGKHEFDIAIVPSDTGRALRGQPGGGVPFGRPIVAIECKDVSTAGSADEMRTFVARLYDVTALNMHARYLTSICSPLTSIHPGRAHTDAPHSSFRQSNLACRSVIVRRTGFAAGALAITGYYFIDPRDHVTQGSSQLTGLISGLDSWIQANLA